MLDALLQPIDWILHVDAHLDTFIKDHGTWVYLLLFAVVFVETGVVVMPLLPGDSLLFAVGMISARSPDLNLWLVMGLLTVAAVLGDAVNYHIGKYLGPKIFRYEAVADQKPTLFMRLLNRQHLLRANDFYVKYGGKAVVLGRFVPVVRTFVPFVAGAGAMNYAKFVWYNVLGAVLWVGICVGAGYLLGDVPWIKRNFGGVVLAIIVVSLIPIVVEWILATKRAKAAKQKSET
ncbi:VTT domain-containing protein [Limnofasciculus baicalensis]|uniref:VTT domain-containing protein n=1 Tax=Limnofasciculus baicalensis BBK-W-15 TaxID=2699891 RepID=A0AAE3GZB6_9CYAN|nr:VTT domain-containing protein [Limnofasciculus baicalensis]MCP2732578.1 VTT domain-containing protein [Limnofasciculus baicalensis BBK-W-15]